MVVKRIEESEAIEEQKTVENSAEWEVLYDPSSSHVWIDIISVIYARVCILC